MCTGAGGEGGGLSFGSVFPSGILSGAGVLSCNFKVFTRHKSANSCWATPVVQLPSGDSIGGKILNMFNMESQPMIT